RSRGSCLMPAVLECALALPQADAERNGGNLDTLNDGCYALAARGTHGRGGARLRSEASRGLARCVRQGRRRRRVRRLARQDRGGGGYLVEGRRHDSPVRQW